MSNKPLPCNGEEGQPCPFGCLFTEIEGKVNLTGDCRAPSSYECYLTLKKEKEYVQTRRD